MPAQKEHDQDEPCYLIIPAAGLGTRMRTVNPDLPKELLPVGHKPAIQYAVEEGISAGIKNIIIIISKQKEIIRRYFEDNKFSKEKFPKAFEEIEKINKVCSLTFLYQIEPLGESDAISYARDIVAHHSVAVFYPDNLYMPAPGALKILKSVYEQYKSDVIALNEVPEDISQSTSNAGRVDIEHLEDNVFRIRGFHPKTGEHFVPRFQGELRACGIYITGPHVFKYIDKVRTGITEEEITDTPVRESIRKDKGILGCRLPGTVFDIGNPKGYELCLKYINSMYNK
jgi:UTP--glucose-1-phosphate uridylyltransferase